MPDVPAPESLKDAEDLLAELMASVSILPFFFSVQCFFYLLEEQICRPDNEKSFSRG